MSKRRLLELVQKGIVAGWDDPRMPTITGLRRAGYTLNLSVILQKKVGVARRGDRGGYGFIGVLCSGGHLNKVAPPRDGSVGPGSGGD